MSETITDMTYPCKGRCHFCRRVLLVVEVDVLSSCKDAFVCCARPFLFDEDPFRDSVFKPVASNECRSRQLQQRCKYALSMLQLVTDRNTHRKGETKTRHTLFLNDAGT